jgi:hypothetical protein
MKHCDETHLEACRGAQALFKRRSVEDLHPAVTLCRAKDAPSCLALARTPRVGREGRLWALAAACRAGAADACATARTFGEPDLRRLEVLSKGIARSAMDIVLLHQTTTAQVDAAREDVADTLKAAFTAHRAPDPASWPENLGPFFIAADESAEVKDWKRRTEGEATRWLRSLPRAKAFGIIRDADACAALAEAGVPKDVLELPVQVLLEKSSDHLVGHEPGRRSTLGLCERAWSAVDEGGASVGQGQLSPVDDYSRFERIAVGAEAERPTDWPVVGDLSLVAEGLLGQPLGVDGASLLLRLEGAVLQTRLFLVRFGFALPFGRNDFGLVPGLGTNLGELTWGPVQWRVLSLAVDLWLVYQQLHFAVVPGAGTTVAFALGDHELSLEAGARYSFPLVWKDTSRLPNQLELSPYVAIGFRPSW